MWITRDEFDPMELRSLPDHMSDSVNCSILRSIPAKDHVY
jgi:hypothetical protein